MAHPQPKRRVQLSNDAKHLHAFHFEGRPCGDGGQQERAGALAAHTAAEAVHEVRRARAADQDDHATKAGVGPPAAAAAA